jgi:hypothetical protein
VERSVQARRHSWRIISEKNDFLVGNEIIHIRGETNKYKRKNKRRGHKWKGENKKNATKCLEIRLVTDKGKQIKKIKK